MTTVILLLIIPIGALFYLQDKKVQKEHQNIFNSKIKQVQQSDECINIKIKNIDEFFYQNGFKIINRTECSFIAEKKYISIGAIMMLMGVSAYFAFLIYYLYYKFFKKPTIYKVNFC